MTNPTHIMIDIETLGTRPGSVILTIGAVAFNPFADVVHIDPNGEPANVFNTRIDIGSSILNGLTVDHTTVNWWRENNSSITATAFFDGPGERLTTALVDFFNWIDELSEGTKIVWSHGAGFDIPIIEAAAHATFEDPEFPLPWKFWNVRDTRTLYDIADIKPERTDNHHHALFDAVDQARAVQAAYRKLGIKETTP